VPLKRCVGGTPQWTPSTAADPSLTTIYSKWLKK
jgi:hypothetical protein